MTDDEKPMRMYEIYCGTCRQEFVVPDDEIPDGAVWHCPACTKKTQPKETK